MPDNPIGMREVTVQVKQALSFNKMSAVKDT